MSPERSDQSFLADIQEAARRIETYTAGMTYGGFLEELETQDAVIRNLEIIGEATKNLSAELRARHTDVPWRGMAGLRDRLSMTISVSIWMLCGRLPQSIYPNSRYRSRS